ncbi:hypothetical protein B4O97_09015 [Marispirochaeta aestuarii]|uniref:Uncharacterized protein n=1 Tax=Marispirochaeta aestuarii TaxID=1963862 RepID=A0A1Y1RY14_9SPIO|nr:hypothetical protein B4O97_09015 [Marispirochaeta aestuarii]
MLQTASEYRRVLTFLSADLEKDLPAVFAEHLKLERELFRRFAASLKVWTGLNLPDGQLEQEIRDVTRRQRTLQDRISQKKNLLQGRLEKGTLPPRPRRLYDENTTFLDISC